MKEILRINENEAFRLRAPGLDMVEIDEILDDVLERRTRERQEAIQDEKKQTTEPTPEKTIPGKTNPTEEPPEAPETAPEKIELTAKELHNALQISQWLEDNR